MFCSKCGEKLNDGSVFCHKCGTPVNAQGVTPVQSAAPQPVQNVAPTVAPQPQPVQYAPFAPVPVQTGKVGVGVGSVIVSSIFALITLGFAVATSIGPHVSRVMFGADEYVLVGLSALLLISCLLFKVAKWLPFIPITLWTCYDVVNYKTLNKMYGARLIINPRTLQFIVILLIPIALVLFITAAFSKGTVKAVTGSIASAVYFIASIVGVGAIISISMKIRSSLPQFMGLASKRLPLYVRFSFYFCCAVIALCVVFAKVRQNKNRV